MDGYPEGMQESSFSGSRRQFLAAGAGLGLALGSSSAAAIGGGSAKLAGIQFDRRSTGRSADWRYLLIHGDESTARQVLNEHTSGRGPALLVRGQTRTVELFGGRLDPNRMFSNEGAEANLRRLNPGWTDGQVLSAVTYLGAHRHELVNKLLPPAGGLLVAMHNNQRGYTMKTEIPISEEVALNDPDHPEDFGLCVDPGDFARVRGGKYNFVLQSRPKGRDDGSLSRLASRLGVRYLNLEARLGNLEKQKAMLEWVEGVLG